MTDLANRDLALDARTARDFVKVAAGYLRTLRTDLALRRYDVAEDTANNAEFQGLRADLNADLIALDGIYRHLDRLTTLLADQADAELTFGQAQVRDALASIVAAGVIDRLQADYFVELAIRAFGPADATAVDTIAVEQVVFALVSDSTKRRIRGGVTLDKLAQAVRSATREVNA